MNDAMVMKQIWEFHENKKNLWTEWLRRYWTRGMDWWHDSVNSNSSWVLKRLTYCIRRSLDCILVGADRVTWAGEGSSLSIHDTYEKLRDKYEDINWSNLVWNKFNARETQSMRG
ncbi:unnamed protein product [Rhodiola kirilowii]